MIEDLAVGKTKDGATDGAEPAIAGDVTSRARKVRCPIGLHHKSSLATEEARIKGRADAVVGTWRRQALGCAAASTEHALRRWPFDAERGPGRCALEAGAP